MGMTLVSSVVFLMKVGVGWWIVAEGAVAARVVCVFLRVKTDV